MIHLKGNEPLLCLHYIWFEMIWNPDNQNKDIEKYDPKPCSIQSNQIAKTFGTCPKMNPFVTFYVIVHLLAYVCDSELILWVIHGFQDWVFVLTLFRWIF